METTTFDIERSMNMTGAREIHTHGHFRSRINQCIQGDIKSEDHYFNLLISLSEYSFAAFARYGGFREVPNGPVNPNEVGCNNVFYPDYSNDIDYDFIYTRLANPMIKKPVYDLYCTRHKDKVLTGMCVDCLERYRVVTRNLIYLMRTSRKDLCSIYFVDILYQLIRFEHRDLYALITYTINNFADGSSFKPFANEFGKKKVNKLLKTLNRPFRRCDFKLILKKYLPLIYQLCFYCGKKRVDCLDKVYDFMLHQGMSMFKHIPSKYIVVGYKVEDQNKAQYRIDILKTKVARDFDKDREYQIASHTLLEGINFGFYTEREKVYRDAQAMDNDIKKKLKTTYRNLAFSGRSIFTGREMHSNNFITIGFLKPSVNTFQNFRLDIHIESLITNARNIDNLRKIKHDQWRFEDNMSDDFYISVEN